MGKSIKKMFGLWSEQEESKGYSGKKRDRRSVVIKKLPEPVQAAIKERFNASSSLVDIRLASAWALQRVQKGVSEAEIINAIHEADPPWEQSSWRKERVEIALLQIASMTNQRKIYFGWKTVLYLSGSDIRAFLRICEQVWELAAKVSPEALTQNLPVPKELQTEGIFEASHHWRLRDRTETHGGGSHRYSVLSSLGPAIHDYLMNDLALSNPGHSGFSVREPDLSSDNATKVAAFLGNGVNWAIFEERPHTSKNREGASRSKWFLHPILSPAFGIPLKRVKEPFYTTVDELKRWFFENAPIRFGTRKSRPEAKNITDSHAKYGSVQRKLPFGGDE